MSAPQETLRASDGRLRQSPLQKLLASPLYEGLEAEFRWRIVWSLPTTKRAHFEWFISKLQVRDSEGCKSWPYNTRDLGYSSISRYIDQVLRECWSKARSPQQHPKARADD
jgi:hypothetical protein